MSNTVWKFAENTQRKSVQNSVVKKVILNELPEVFLRIRIQRNEVSIM